METPTETTRPRAGRAVLLGGALAALLVTACSSGDGDGSRAITETLDPQSSGEQATDDGDDTGEASDSQPSEGSASDEVLATTRAELTAGVNDEVSAPIRIDVTRLERDGELVELTLVMTYDAEPAEGVPFFQREALFGDAPESSTNRRLDISAIGLVDEQEQMLYLPAFDSAGTCLCSSTANMELAAGESLTLQATFGGVPEGVEEVDVRIPNFPTITGMPVG